MSDSESIKTVPISGREGFYEISSDGYIMPVVCQTDPKWVRSSGLGVRSRFRAQQPVGLRITPMVNYDGHLKVVLYDEGYHRHYDIDSLVADAFLPRDDTKSYIRHKNLIRTDNRASNLERCTSDEYNEYYAIISRQVKNKDPIIPPELRSLRKNYPRIHMNSIEYSFSISHHTLKKIIGGEL